MIRAHLYGPWSRGATQSTCVEWEKSEEFERSRRKDAHHSRLPSSLSFARTPLAHPISVWRAECVDKQRTGEKSTAVATRGASPRTLAIAHTYLYTVIFKMKEKRAGGRVVVAVVHTLPRAQESPCENKGRR